MPGPLRVEYSETCLSKGRLAMRENLPAKPFDPGVTRASLFLRLRSDQSVVRELSWVEFDRLYTPFIRGYAQRLGFAGQDVDELAQRVLVGFFSAAPSFVYDPTKGRFRGYLTWATRTASIRLRTRGMRAVALGEYDPALPSEDDAEAEKVWARVVATRALEEAKGCFTDKTYEAFELYVRRGVPAEEVASRLSMSVDSVHQARTRVSKKAREIVARIREVEG